MKRAAMIATVVVLTVIGLSGCNFFFSLILDADLTVESVQVLESAGDITGFRITFGNYGGGVEGVPFAVVLSDDTVVSPTAGDFIIYEGSFDIDWNKSQQIDVSRDEINTYLGGSAGGYVPAGEFYVGVFVDHLNEIDEGDETDNESTTPQTYFFGGGGSADVAADSYESDDVPGDAAFISSGSAQARTFDIANDRDWISFSAATGVPVTIGTSYSSGIESDTVIYVYDSSTPFAVDFDPYADYLVTDDDGGNGAYSLISNWIPTATGTYYILVEEFFGNLGHYTIELQN